MILITPCGIKFETGSERETHIAACKKCKSAIKEGDRAIREAGMGKKQIKKPKPKPRKGWWG